MANLILCKHFQEIVTTFDVAVSLEVLFKCYWESSWKCFFWNSRTVLAITLWAWGNEKFDKESIWVLCDIKVERGYEKESKISEKDQSSYWSNHSIRNWQKPKIKMAIIITIMKKFKIIKTTF